MSEADISALPEPAPVQPAQAIEATELVSEVAGPVPSVELPPVDAKLEIISDANELVTETEGTIAAPLPKKGKGSRSLRDYAGLDWTKRDTELAKQCGVSRERIRQVRKDLKKATDEGTPVSASGFVFSDTTGEESKVAADFSDLTTEEPIAKAAVNYQVMAETTFDMSIFLMVTAIGPEWNPREYEVNGNKLNERSMVVEAMRKYYEAKQLPDLPPGVMLCLVLGSYSAARFAVPNTSSKLKLAWAWTKVKVGGIFGRFFGKKHKAVLTTGNNESKTT